MKTPITKKNSKKNKKNRYPQIPLPLAYIKTSDLGRQKADEFAAYAAKGRKGIIHLYYLYFWFDGDMSFFETDEEYYQFQDDFMKVFYVVNAWK